MNEQRDSTTPVIARLLAAACFGADLIFGSGAVEVIVEVLPADDESDVIVQQVVVKYRHSRLRRRET